MNDKSGHRERLREKFSNQGMQGFHHQYEKLEFLLTFIIPQKDVKPIAKELLEKFETIENIFKADIKELKKVSGIGEIVALCLKFLGELNKDLFKEHYKKNKISISSKNDIVAYLKNEIGFDIRENFFVVYLDSANCIINDKELKSEVLFKGTLDRSAVYPREIVTNILSLKEYEENNFNKNIIEKSIGYRAKSVIIAHNHPSGNIRPSKSDIELTQSLKESLSMIDIRLLDHIIVTKEAYFSFLEEGLLG